MVMFVGKALRGDCVGKALHGDVCWKGITW